MRSREHAWMAGEQKTQRPNRLSLRPSIPDMRYTLSTEAADLTAGIQTNSRITYSVDSPSVMRKFAVEERTRSRLMNTTLLVGSFILALMCAEVIVRLFIPVRDVGPLFTVNDSVTGKRIKKNFSTIRVTPEFTMRFTSNSLGHRGKEPGLNSSATVVFLGDSFTMGYGVNDGEEFPALLGDKLDAVFGSGTIRVVKAGVGNSGNGRWVKFLNYEIATYEPKLIILQFMANDFSDNLRENYYSISDENTLEEMPIYVSTLKSMESYLDAIPGLSQSHLYSLARQSIADWQPADTRSSNSRSVKRKIGTIDYARRLTYRLLEEALEICERKGFPVLAMLVGLQGDILVEVRDLFENRGIGTVAIPTKVGRPDLYYEIDGHWNAAGHKFATNALFQRISSLDLTGPPLTTKQPVSVHRQDSDK